MSDIEQDSSEIQAPSELDTLKHRADQLGISYHPSIGADKLRAKINAKLDGTPDPDAVAAAPAPAPVLTKSEEVASNVETEGQKRARIKKQANELVRVNVQCMNPLKKEWEGEIITAGNSLVGTFKKYIPFDTTEGWHIPRIIYNVLKERKFLDFVKRKDANGRPYLEKKLNREFAIEVLDPLTPAELAELGRRQAMRDGKTV